MEICVWSPVEMLPDNEVTGFSGVSSIEVPLYSDRRSGILCTVKFEPWANPEFAFQFFQQLELLMQAQGLSSGMQDDIDTFAAALLQNNASQQYQQQQMQNISLTQASTRNFSPIVTVAPIETLAHPQSLLDDLMDDTSPLGVDPMLSSEPVSPNVMDDSDEL